MYPMEFFSLDATRATAGGKRIDIGCEDGLWERWEPWGEETWVGEEEGWDVGGRGTEGIDFVESWEVL